MLAQTAILVFLVVFVSLPDQLYCVENNINGSAKSVQASEEEFAITVRQMWKDQERQLKSTMNTVIKQNMGAMMREVYSRNISSFCLNSLLQLTGALRQTKLWAFQMIDASGKIPVGFLSGTLTSLGNYQECLDIDIDKPKVKVKGQYCLVHITPPLPQWKPFMSLHLPVPELTNVSAPDTLIAFMTGFIHNLHITSIKAGICIPSACTKDDVDRLIQIIPGMTSMDWKFNVNRCETKTSFQFSVSQMVFIYFFMIAAVVVLISTLADLIFEEELGEKNNVKGTIFKFVRCFSLRLNMVKTANYVSPERNLRFVYGMMFYSLIWIVSGNAFLCINYDTAANFMEAIRMTKNLFYEILVSRINPAQTLLFLSAFLTTFKWLKSPDQSLSIWKYLLKAYIRYTPTYALLIALMMITPGWGSGPAWMSYMASTYSNCKANWWTNLLYVNNYVNAEEMCLPATWFVAISAQLYVLALIVLIPLKKRPKLGLVINLALAVLSFFAVFLRNMQMGIPPTEIISFLNERDRVYYAVQSYFHIYYHGMVYCAGIFAGYLVAMKPTMKFSAKLSYSLWTLTSVITIVMLCLVYKWSEGNMPTPIVSACYDVFRNLTWATFLFWMSVSCAIEQKGLCYSYMSWRPFAFFSRIVFSTIVMNAALATIIFSFKKSHLFVSHFEIFYNLATLVICNFIISYTFYVGLESPLLQLTQVLKKTCGGKTFNSTLTSETNITIHFNEVLTEKPPKIITEKFKDKKSLEAHTNQIVEI